ncbi:MAG: phage virion morphogenesis protein [Pseudomonadota bacterium]
MIEVKIDNKNVLDALDRLTKATANPRPALLAIGESLVVSTKKRFETSTAPDGSKWQPNSDTTLRMGLHSGNHFKKNGSLKKSGSSYLSNKKPLIGKTHSLATEIFPKFDSNGLRIGSRLEYAAMQQFGGTTSLRSMIPGKRIPARPFLGISDSDETMILKTVNDYLRSVVG